MNKFQLGGSIFNEQSIAAARGAGLTEGLIKGAPRLGSAVVQDGTFIPATMVPPVGPMLQTNMINLLWGNQDSTRFNLSQDNVRQYNNSINNSTNNITTREVPVAQQGDKLPQIESNNARPLMGLFRHMIPGFNNAYKLKLYLAAYLLKQRQKFLSNLHKLPFMEPAVKADMNTYNGGQLPGITVEAVDLSKPQRFPYGGINVESKSVRGSLDRKQRTYVNPFEGHNLVAKNQEGNKLPIALDAKERYSGGERIIKSGKYYNDSISVRAVKSKSPWYKHPALILERILHSNVDPMFNDTTYAELPSRGFLIKGAIRAAGNDYYSGKKKRWQYPIFGDFFNFNNEKSTPEDKAEYDTLKRRFNTAWKVSKQQGGGPIERADNTRVVSGRPQQVLNKIPYGAGKGPAGEGPMRLFNDPYINMGLMAMAPMAVKIQSKSILAPAQRMESLPVSTNQNYGLLRLYRSAQLKGYKGTIEDFIALSSEILGTPQAMGPEGNKFLGYNLERGNNVLYSRPNPENPKVEGLTVNEPARWQELLKKIIK